MLAVKSLQRSLSMDIRNSSSAVFTPVHSLMIHNRDIFFFVIITHNIRKNRLIKYNIYQVEQDNFNFVDISPNIQKHFILPDTGILKDGLSFYAV